MKKDDILSMSAIPYDAPGYYKGPYRFVHREYFIIPYTTTKEAIAKALPEPLTPGPDNIVKYEFMKMPDSYSGFGDYCETGLVIPCLYKGKPMAYITQMYLNCFSPVAGGREIWGFPKKFANPSLSVKEDTLVGTLDYAGERVSMGTMVYKQKDLLHPTFSYPKGKKPDTSTIEKMLTSTQVNLKVMPDVDGKPAIAQLVAYELQDVDVKGAWQGNARLHFVPHVQAPLADFPVLEVHEAYHIIADLTLPYGYVLHDYLAS